MVKGLYTAYTGMINEQHRMDTLTNNLANADTTGFKKEGATSQSFDSVLAYKIKDLSEGRGLTKHIGSMNMGVKIGENYTDYSAGALKQTENPLDLAISGNGFFSVEFTNKAGETSTKYTKDGSFVVNTAGYLVTKDGDYILGEDGRIQVDPLQMVQITELGAVYQGREMIDTLAIVDFEDYNYLEHYGENMYQTVDGAQEQDANVTVRSGYLEQSNVQIVSEMVEMIAVTRAYETNQKIVQTMDSTLEIAANQLGKL